LFKEWRVNIRLENKRVCSIKQLLYINNYIMESQISP